MKMLTDSVSGSYYDVHKCVCKLKREAIQIERSNNISKTMQYRYLIMSMAS